MILVIFNLTFVSCKSKPLPDSGFLQQTGFMVHDPHTPFDDIWFKEGVDLRKYNKILVRPVDTTHLLKMSWWDKAGLFAVGNFNSDIQLLAEYMRKEVIDAYQNNKDHKYEIVEQPDADTLIIELALVEVIPTKVWLNAVSYLIVGAVDTGSAAMEGRFRDGGTNDILVTLKDHENGQYSLVSIADLQWYSHARHIMQHWAGQFVQMCDLAPGTPISSQFPFTLRPW